MFNKVGSFSPLLRCSLLLALSLAFLMLSLQRPKKKCVRAPQKTALLPVRATYNGRSRKLSACVLCVGLCVCCAHGARIIGAKRQGGRGGGGAHVPGGLAKKGGVVHALCSRCCSRGRAPGARAPTKTHKKRGKNACARCTRATSQHPKHFNTWGIVIIAAVKLSKRRRRRTHHAPKHTLRDKKTSSLSFSCTRLH